MENIDDIILKSKLLFNYDTKKTLTENVNENFKSNELEEGVSELGENAAAMNLIAKAGDDVLRTAGDDVARLLGGKHLMTKGSKAITTGDEFLAAIRNNALTPKAKSDLAKTLMKMKPTPTLVDEKLRKLLVSRAAEISLKDANYIAKNGDELANSLKTKGYNDDIANEIGKKFDTLKAKKAKTPKPNPQDVDNAVKRWGESIKNWPWNKLLKWGLGVGLSVAVLYGIYKLTHKDEPPLPPDPPTPTERYRDCTGTYTQGCKSEVIKQVQTCLGVVPDGKFWVKTQAALVAKGFSNGFKDSDVSKICGGNTPTPAPSPELSPEQQTNQDYGVTPQPNPQAEVQTTNDSIDNY